MQLTFQSGLLIDGMTTSVFSTSFATSSNHHTNFSLTVFWLSKLSFSKTFLNINYFPIFLICHIFSDMFNWQVSVEKLWPNNNILGRDLWHRLLPKLWCGEKLVGGLWTPEEAACAEGTFHRLPQSRWAEALQTQQAALLQTQCPHC